MILFFTCVNTHKVMSKKRRTKAEKVKSAQKVSLLHSSSVPTYSFVSQGPLKEQVKTPQALSSKPIYSYSYVLSDMRQTFVITSILVACAGTLYFLIQNQIIRLSIFGY